LSLYGAWSHLEESLDVIPAQGLAVQQSRLLETFKVVTEALGKQILFILKLGVEAGLIDSGSHFQFVKTGVSKPALPKNRQRPLQDTLAVEFFGSSHCSTIDYCTDWYEISIDAPQTTYFLIEPIGFYVYFE
jgi:hypothetical protein